MVIPGCQLAETEPLRNIPPSPRRPSGVPGGQYEAEIDRTASVLQRVLAET